MTNFTIDPDTGAILPIPDETDDITGNSGADDPDYLDGVGEDATEASVEEGPPLSLLLPDVPRELSLLSQEAVAGRVNVLVGFEESARALGYEIRVAKA